jgi:hypothetical protein
MELEAQRPRFVLRCTTLFGWYIPIFALFSFFAFREPIPVDLSLLTVPALAGISIAIPGFIRVVRLRPKRESKLRTVIVSVV